MEQRQTTDIADAASDPAVTKPARRSWTKAVVPSSLVARIALINILGLLMLSLGILYFNQLRQGLINARSESLMVQAQIIASAIAGAATVDTSSIVIDPDKLDADPTQGAMSDDALGGSYFPISPDRAGPVLRRLLANTSIRGQIIDTSGSLIVDSNNLADSSLIIQTNIVPQRLRTWGEYVLEPLYWVGDRLFAQNFPKHEEYGLDNNQTRPEISAGLGGATVTLTRLNAAHETTVLVVVPVQRFRAIQGALILSTEGGAIDSVLRSERRIVFLTFGFSALVALVLSTLLASTIARPIRRLSAAADRVRRGINHSRVEIPDFTSRSDEIGQLSGSLRHMTQALYNRIAAIEGFAADVAHELKNPLTSMRSAVETLHYAKTDAQRSKLVEIVVHDVKRMDRLISDISDASRLDAELARAELNPINFADLVGNITTHANDTAKADMARVEISVANPKSDASTYMILGHDSRLGQVLRNLIDNARSFTAPGTVIQIKVRRVGDEVEARIEDEGPGIPPENMERIFERFYTDRPEQNFGGNSGLGLAISRQVVEAHKGRIWAENIQAKISSGEENKILGARFIIRLPAMPLDWQADQ